MSTIQERLQLKRVPLDKWTVREQLCLASAVACSGDQNWMSVSRSLKMNCLDRPTDWFSQKACAAQYGKLLENVETPKRKKRTEKEIGQTPVETPVESILRKLKQEYIEELRKLIQNYRQQYNRINKEIYTVECGKADDLKLQEMWAQLEAEIKQNAKEQLRHAQWLKEREERKLEIERTWRPNPNLYQHNSPNQSPSKALQLNIKIKSDDVENDDSNSRQGTSPLLTSLLKSPSPAPNPASSILLNTANTPTSTRAAAPTITHLLTGSVPNIPTNIPNHSGIFSVQLQTQPLTGPPPQDHIGNTITQSPSQAAPTLSMLLENKNKETNHKMPPLVQIEVQQSCHQDQNLDQYSANNDGKGNLFPLGDAVDTENAESPIKDEDQQLMEVFNGMIPDNIDELADILTENNAIILTPELLEEESMLENVESLMEEQDNIGKQSDVNEYRADTFQENQDHSADLRNPALRPDETENQRDKDFVMEKNDHPKPSTSVVLTDVDPIVVIKDDEQSNVSNDAPPAIQPDTEIEEIKEEDDECLKKEEPDNFESDSNDDKCLESIKREIQSLSGLKENSDNSNEETEKFVIVESKLKEEENKDNVNSNLVAPTETKADFENVAPIEEAKLDVYKTLETETIEPAEIVEIKDDKSDDEKPDTVILIEETDDTISEETISDDVKIETDVIKTNENDAVKKPDTKDRKISTDEECFDDVKENNEIKSDDIENIIEPKSLEQTITIIDTDDDSPIEVIKEEEKTGKTKRDYSRKKQDSTNSERRSEEKAPVDDSKANLSVRMKLKDRERSESPFVDEDGGDHIPRSRRRYSSTPNIDSLPNSPASSDDREYKVWKKSILMVYNRISNHKFSSIFLKPITDEQAPRYKATILRPMDLLTIKRNIESGIIRTTADFQRDVMLMCYNAIVYNSRDHITRSMAEELMNDALMVIEIIMDTWKRENEKSLSSASSGSCTKIMRGRKSPRLPLV